MRPIHIVQLDKLRPAVILTRATVRPFLSEITVAPITTSSRGLATEVPVGPANGLNQHSVVVCDNIGTVDVSCVGKLLGFLLVSQEQQLSVAIAAAFDLEDVSRAS